MALDESTTFLLTASAAHRLVPGQNGERWPIDLGIAPALTPDYLVFWSRGALRRALRAGGEPSVLASLERQPQRMVTAKNRIAWLESDAAGHYAVKTLDGSGVRVLVAPEAAYLNAIGINDSFVYFVERAPDMSWRFGCVPLDGGTPRYTGEKQGRTPAMFVVADQIFYYDGPSSTLRQVALDLSDEQVVAKNVICSPLAVAEHLYCAQPAGITELDRSGTALRNLELSRRGVVTAMAASSSQLTWLLDIGENRLAVESVRLADR